MLYSTIVADISLKCNTDSISIQDKLFNYLFDEKLKCANLGTFLSIILKFWLIPASTFLKKHQCNVVMTLEACGDDSAHWPMFTPFSAHQQLLLERSHNSSFQPISRATYLFLIKKFKSTTCTTGYIISDAKLALNRTKPVILPQVQKTG